MARKFTATITDEIVGVGSPIRFNLGKFPTAEAAQSAVNAYLGALISFDPVFDAGTVIKSTASALLGHHKIDVVIQ